MSMNKKLAIAALAGLLSTGAMISGAHAEAEMKMMLGKEAGVHAGKEKHACKGQNSCAGNGQDGKNSCKGQGSCATDGSNSGGHEGAKNTGIKR